jgi:hypothetical protein
MINKNQPESPLVFDNKNIYHQAGHAAAICLGNKQKGLPAVFFQVTVETIDDKNGVTRRSPVTHPKYRIKIDGGRLIQNLPMSFAEAIHNLSKLQQDEFRRAFEADVINILVGSLAEAKYVLSQDNEVFNPHLINLNALYFYGGSADLEVIQAYMNCFISDKADRERKLTELFLAAFNFVNHRSNWSAINALAQYILNESGDIFGCEDIASILEAKLAA